MFKTRHLALAICIFIGLQAQARGQELFEEGFTAFQAGDYEVALGYFQASRARGRADDELLYNIAICHYRLGEWEQANLLLSDLYNKMPEQARIGYNLAVTEKSLGRTQRARQLFLEVALSSSTSELAVLANRQYQLLSHDRTTIAGAKIDKRWLASADVRVGTDDNVIDPSDLAESNEGDSFMETMLTGRWYSNSNPRRGWVVDGYAFLSRYSQVSEYDVDMGDVGFKNYLATDYGSWYFGGRADSSQLDGDGYLQSLTFNLGTGGQLESGGYWNTHYHYREIDSLSEDFDALKGSNQRIRLDYGGRVGAQSRWKMDYRYERDDREDADYEFAFASYSADRHSVGASWAYTDGDLRGTLRASYRRSVFSDDNLFEDGGSEAREDDRLKVSLRAAWYFGPNWALTAEYSFTDNDSSIDSYDYRSQVMTFGVGWQL